MFGFFVFLRDKKPCVHVTAPAVPSEMHMPYLGAGSVGFSSVLEEPSSCC